MTTPPEDAPDEPPAQMAVAQSSTLDSRRPASLAFAAIRLEPVWLLLLIVGIYGAGLGWRTGAFLALAAVCGRIGGHMLVGLTEYRRIMAMPWPQVEPLTEDDDW